MRFPIQRQLATTIALTWLVVSDGFFPVATAGGFDYKDALTKSLLFLEAQRSGKLPSNNRVPWRGHSGLQDGQYAHVNLVGGYYDAGDNVKYGLPMAFTITTLAWGTLAYRTELEATGEFDNALDAIKWGTDYFIKAARRKNHLWVQVGDPVKDHQCWARPENMNTPRTLYQIAKNIPGTEIAAETAAAMAAASILFRGRDQKYSRRVLNRAKLLFDFADTYRGTYDGECPFYCSFSGYQDELLWAATWLYVATKKIKYYRYITEEAISNSVAEFNWDLKFAGAQVLLSGLHFNGDQRLSRFKTQADNYVCAVLPDSPFSQIYISPGGLIHMRDGANTQYVTGAALLLSVYGDMLAKNNQKVSCGTHTVEPSRLLDFAKKQMDYLLGSNPLGQSYMVGFGSKSPTQAHHRGASVPPMSQATVINCGMSFTKWFNVDRPNPNELTGAIVGGPDRDDNFDDKRWDSSKLEPTTYINSLAVGVLAKLAAQAS